MGFPRVRMTRGRREESCYFTVLLPPLSHVRARAGGSRPAESPPRSAAGSRAPRFPADAPTDTSAYTSVLSAEAGRSAPGRRAPGRLVQFGQPINNANPPRAAPAHEAAVEAKSPGSPRPYGQIHTFARPRSRDGRRHARPLLVRRRRAHLPGSSRSRRARQPYRRTPRGRRERRPQHRGRGRRLAASFRGGRRRARPHERQAVARIGARPRTPGRASRRR